MTEPIHDPRPLLKRGKMVGMLIGDVSVLLVMLIGWGAGVLDATVLTGACMALAAINSSGLAGTAYTDGKKAQRGM